MEEKPWDKLLLVAVAVIAAGVSGLFIMKALGFPELFGLERPDPDDTLPETSTGIVKIAQEFVVTENSWSNPTRGAAPKPVTLFRSIPLVEKDGEVIDMLDPNAPLLRPPVSNAWLLQNNLDYLNAGVLGLDPDNDGFTNMAEWEAKTNPKDASSRPPYSDKLSLIERKQQEYKLTFMSKPDAERFQIRREPTARWPSPENFYLRIGETSDDGQFRLDSYEERFGMRNGIRVDTSVLTITYLPKNEEHQITRRVAHAIPTYFAFLAFSLDPGNTIPPVKEGEAFTLALDPDTKYRLIKVEPDVATITYQTGTDPEVTVEIKSK